MAYYKHILSLVILTFVLISCQEQDTPMPAPTYWPTNGWQTSTPEQQGMDSEQLAAMLTTIQAENHNLVEEVFFSFARFNNLCNQPPVH